MAKRALITGITGQDGSYLAELLLERGYEVHGIVRRVAVEEPDDRLSRIRHILPRLHLHGATLENYASLYRVVGEVKPDEIYHLAAISFVSYSFQDEFSTTETNITGTHYMLSIARDLVPKARFYFAGTSEMFGNAQVAPQNESTPFHPQSPYAASKVAGFYLARYFREACKMPVFCGMLYNHESPRRGLEFVTRKITVQAAKIKLGLAREIRLGNLEPRRDWGHARDYVEAMWRMMQTDRPDDYVIATGENHTVREFLDLAFHCAGLDADRYLVTDPQLQRQSDVINLIGDASKARREFGWAPNVTFVDLVREMVDADLKRFTTAKTAAAR